MSIDFTASRWDKIKEDSDRWWAGELKRPLIQVTLGGADAGRKEPAIADHSFTSLYDLEIPAEAIVDRWDYNLSRCTFLGDGFPTLWPNFGPGVIPAMMGANLENGDNTVWYHPTEKKELAELSFAFDPGNVWFNRIKDLYEAGLKRWEGLVQLGMTDLGGNLDILSTFRPGEELLFDLYDSPEAVKRLTWAAHGEWFEYFDAFNRILQPVNPGYTAWTPIFSTQPYYILQCDFCYMIGPDMFDEFVKPELTAACKRLANPFYHLDGPGQLAHLDSLLSIDELKGVQWVPGEGSGPFDQWPHVYRKIRDAGKLIQISGGPEVIDTIAGQLGSAEGLILITVADIGQEPVMRELLTRYGVSP